ncbi:MAG: class I SAM-dependent methyltransferase [Candidatus Peregrinibacteria bacterium]
MSSNRFTREDFRQTRNSECLPEEIKKRVEGQMKVLGELRELVREALKGGEGKLSSRILRKLERAVEEGENLRERVKAVLKEGAQREGEDARPGKIDALIVEEIGKLEAELKKLGGSTREIVVGVLRKLDLERYWFDEAFSPAEQLDVFPAAFTGLEKATGVPPHQWRSLSLGPGIGRDCKIALRAFREDYGRRNVPKFAAKLHAVDLMPRFVEATQRALRPLGVPEGHVIEGDFMDLPTRFRQEKFHLIWALMHTLFHCTTQDELRKTLHGIEEALAPGGRLLLDTVGLYHHRGLPSQKRIQQSNDLMNFYDLLVRIYAETHIAPRLGKDADFKVSRFPIDDHTARCGSYPREVLTRRYLEHVLGEMGSSLHIIDTLTVANSRYPKDQAQALGMQWIRENQLEEWLRREIAYRLRQSKKGKRTIRPYYSLSAGCRADQVRDDTLTREMNSKEVTDQLQALAIKMVQGYVQRYHILEKPGKRRKKGKKE